jgi:hypothetical protein
MKTESSGPNKADQIPVALKAAEAGAYLAKALGLPDSISEQSMWAYARSNTIPAVRIGRRIWFTTESLTRFIANGGSPRTSKGAEVKSESPSAVRA